MSDIPEQTTFDDFIAFYSEAIKEDDFTEWVSDATYNGFNPETIFKLLVIKARELGVKKADFYGMILKLVIFYAMSGSNFKRDDRKWISKEAKARIQALMTNFGVQVNLEGAKDNSNTITLARVALVFPEMVAALYLAGIGKPIVTKEGFPYELSFPGGCTLMTEDEWKTHKEAYYDLMTDFSITVSRNKKEDDINSTKGKSRAEIRVIQQNYADIARNGNFVKSSLVKRRAGVISMSKSLKPLAAKVGATERKSSINFL